MNRVIASVTTIYVRLYGLASVLLWLGNNKIALINAFLMLTRGLRDDVVKHIIFVFFVHFALKLVFGGTF